MLCEHSVLLALEEMRNSESASRTIQHAIGSREAVTLAAARNRPLLLLMGEFVVVSDSGNCWSKKHLR